MQCEVCGRTIIGKPHRVIIEGAKMTTCENCAKLGSSNWRPETISLKQPAKKMVKTVVRSIPIRKESSLKISEDTELAEDFGSRVREAREKSGLSLNDMGRKIGEKVSVIKKIESAKIVPDERLAAKIEHVLRIKLLVPFTEPKDTFQSPPPRVGVTIGEIVHLKSEKRRTSENEGDHSSSERPD